METEKPTDAIALLKADHRRVEQLFEDYEKAKRRRRGKACRIEFASS